jgi:uncharacterized protein
MMLREIPQACKSVIERHYGDQFMGLILFGSMARDDGDSASDIDLLVLLSEPFDYFRELRTLVDLLYPIQLESNRLISAKPAALADFERGALQLYRNAKREGVAV